MQPSTIIVDDAPIDLTFLSRLKRLREKVGAELMLLVSSWNGDRDEIEQALNIAPERVRKLERLTRDDIVLVVNAGGERLANWFTQLKVDQAEGLPGLAATIAQVARLGDWKSVARGLAIKPLRDGRCSRKPQMNGCAMETIGIQVTGRC